MSNIQVQRQNSIASLQRYQQAKAKAAPLAPLETIPTPAPTPVQIAHHEEHDREASASVTALHRLQEAQHEDSE